MPQALVDLARVKQCYQAWLAANKPSFRFHSPREVIVKSLAELEPESIVDVDRTIAHWPEPIEVCATNLIGVPNVSPGFVANRPVAMLDYGRRHQ